MLKGVLVFLRAWGSHTAQFARQTAYVASIVLGLWLTVTLTLGFFAEPDDTNIEFTAGNGKRLVVVVHGLSGRAAIQPTVDLARNTLPDADLLTIEYDAHPLSNADVYEITNRLEDAIHNAHQTAHYESIILLGHSMGATLVRKALLWANGLEADRAAKKGAHDWAAAVDRVVSLAGINRGWSIDPRPAKIGLVKYFGIWLGESIARLTATGKLLLSVQRGASFVADSRVQWIRFARRPSANGPAHRLPQVIHLLGDRDDIVSREDARDLNVARDTVFVTLADTDHASIAEAVKGGQGADADNRRTAIRNALLGNIDALSPDKDVLQSEEPAVKRVIYVMHGIRDYGGWTDLVRTEIEKRTQKDPAIAVINKKYGDFPMLRFLLYWDRQKNVRRLMDEYTENLAKYPNAEVFDFVGHSNGTYILASALQHYETISVGRVFLAGSVVPKHYPWRKLLETRRVKSVVNVVANGDWVVGIFPKLFEQFADWLSVQPTIGVLVLGSAGFRGFEDAADPQGRVRNKYTDGSHGAGVAADKIDAIVSYMLEGTIGDEGDLKDAAAPLHWLDMSSNVTWLIWALLIALVLAVISLAFMLHSFAGAAVAVSVVLFLMSF